MGNQTIVLNQIGQNIYALIENGKISEIKIATSGPSNIKISQQYCARVKTIDLRLNAAFVDLGDAQGLLPFKGKRPQYLIEGKAILVEVTREAFAEKLGVVNYIGDAKANTPCPSLIHDIDEWGEWSLPTPANNDQKEEIEGILDMVATKTFTLPNGGNICIEQTRAMTVIDIDAAGRIVGGTNQLNFNHKLNREAANKIGQIIRLFNISGLIAIDFVGSPYGENAKELHDILSKALINGQKFEILPISRFGICEISRSRKGLSLFDLHNNQAQWVGINAINSLAKLLLTAKGKVLELRINTAAFEFLNTWNFDWKTYINEKIGGRYNITPIDIKNFEII